VQTAQHTDTVNELPKAQGDDRQTAWHLAPLEGKTQILEKLMWDANKKLTTDEVNYKLLLAKDCREQKIWHVAVKDC
jgi:hypothetical protein